MRVCVCVCVTERRKKDDLERKIDRKYEKVRVRNRTSKRKETRT
jgi:hypothetical protein